MMAESPEPAGLVVALSVEGRSSPDLVSSRLAALQKDKPRWSTPRRLAGSQIRDQRMLDIVCEDYHLLSYWYFFLAEHLSNILLLSIIVINYLFRLVNHKTGIKASVCINQIYSVAL